MRRQVEALRMFNLGILAFDRHRRLGSHHLGIHRGVWAHRQPRRLFALVAADDGCAAVEPSYAMDFCLRRLASCRCQGSSTSVVRLRSRRCSDGLRISRREWEYLVQTECRKSRYSCWVAHRDAQDRCAQCKRVYRLSFLRFWRCWEI